MLNVRAVYTSNRMLETKLKSNCFIGFPPNRQVARVFISDKCLDNTLEYTYI